MHQEWRRWRFLLRAARESDVIHFNAGTTIMPLYVDRASTAAHIDCSTATPAPSSFATFFG